MMLIINAIVCGLIVLRLVSFVRTGRYRPFISALAYFFTVFAGVEAILSLYSIIAPPSYTELALKALLCFAIFRSRGNVATLFKLAPKPEKRERRQSIINSPRHKI